MIEEIDLTTLLYRLQDQSWVVTDYGASAVCWVLPSDSTEEEEPTPIYIKENI